MQAVLLAAELSISPELAVAILVAVVGLSGWLTSISFKLGSMQANLENTVNNHGQRIELVESRSANHEARLLELERPLFAGGPAELKPMPGSQKP